MPALSSRHKWCKVWVVACRKTGSRDLSGKTEAGIGDNLRWSAAYLAQYALPRAHPTLTGSLLWNHTFCTFRNTHHVNSTLPGLIYFAQYAQLLLQRTICLQDITDFAVHFFRLRRAIRYALGANLGKDQTVMLDWWDDEKMTVEKLPRPSWWYQKVIFWGCFRTFYLLIELLLRKPKPSPD